MLWEAISNRQVLSLYQGLGTKNLQSFIAQFVYFYGYSYFKRLYLEKSGAKKIGTKANLLLAAAAGACTALATQVRRLILINVCFMLSCVLALCKEGQVLLFLELFCIRIWNVVLMIN